LSGNIKIVVLVTESKWVQELKTKENTDKLLPYDLAVDLMMKSTGSGTYNKANIRDLVRI